MTAPTNMSLPATYVPAGASLQCPTPPTCAPASPPQSTISRMDFGAALQAVKEGQRVSRAGWNAGGQFVVLQKGYPDGIPINANTAEATGIDEGTVCRFRPYLMLCTAQGDFVPWAPSVSDVLAEDWIVVR